MGLTLLAAFLTGLGFLVWYVVAAPGSQVLGRSLVCGPPSYAKASDGPPDLGKIALTFDDGPGEATPIILDMLKQAGIRATFFLCGQNVERYPDIARRIAEEGHEIGNHTYSHPRLLGRTPGKIAYEIERAQTIIAHHTGRRPRLFRPPFGLRWFGLFTILERNGLTSVMWSVNSLDWKRPVEQIVARVVNGIRPGAIVLFHDGVPPHKSADRKVTVEAVRVVLHAVLGRYQCVPVSEL
jgi:peptidoglycan/xylan/chitin deacetylase (PgdA/CDA1 family)